MASRAFRRVCRRSRRYASQGDGFSMLEVLVVVSIMLIVAAISTPNLMKALADMRLRSSVNTVAALLQEGRIRAVRDNSYYRVIGSPVGNTDTNTICLDLNNNGTCTASSDNLDPQARLQGTVMLTKTTAPPVSAASAADFSSTNFNIIEQDKNLQVYFNSRGLPCVPSGSVCKTFDSSSKPYAYIYYLTDQRPIYGWAAVTVSPMGRIRVFMYNGSAWGQ